MNTLKKLLFIALLVTISGYTFANANAVKQNKTEDRHLTGFHAVNVAGSFDVYITQGSTESVKVDAPANVIDRIITEVEGGILKIYTKNNNGFNFNWGNNKRMIVYVSIKEVNSVALTGSGDVFFKNGLKAPTLAIKLNGSGDVSGRVDVRNLETNLSGSGDITLTGRAETSQVSVVGSGDFTGQNLVTNSTTVKVAGSGDARVNATEKIDASVAGSGDVHYTGGATNVSSAKAGSGDISRI